MALQIQRLCAGEWLVSSDDCHLATIKRTPRGHVITDHWGNFDGIQPTQIKAEKMVREIYSSA